MEVFLGILLAGAAGLAGLLLFGAWRWNAQTREWRSRIEAPPAASEAKPFDPAAHEDLPPPVLRYLRAALPAGQPPIVSARIAQSGTFNMSEDGEDWKDFTAVQHVTAEPPGFLWDARIRMMPGLSARVHDAYARGEGFLHASLFGLVTVAHLRDRQETARGERMRFLAEAPWVPTVLLPGDRLRWEPVDETSANAVFTDGGTSVSLLFRFREDGLVESVRSEARPRMVGKKTVDAPWEGRWLRYETREGMRVPVEGEVAWLLPEGRMPYWRGKIGEIAYHFADRVS